MYVYDAENSPIGMQYHGASYASDAWDVYWYEKNLQGDIVAVYDNTGTRLVTYKYDAWGQHTTHYEASGGNTSVTKNPFRYRGYYYDTDLGLYYNISRYYDAYTGRWINADSLVSTGQGILGYNMYAYCLNNPIMSLDYDGNAAMPFWDLPWMGYIHRVVQEYLRDKYHYDIEVSVIGGRVDVKIDNDIYEIKPVTTSDETARKQLQRYIDASGGTLKAGGNAEGLTGVIEPSDKTLGYTIKYYFRGDGVIKYYFYKEKVKQEITVPDVPVLGSKEDRKDLNNFKSPGLTGGTLGATLGAGVGLAISLYFMSILSGGKMPVAPYKVFLR